jgi:hypothetical protein
MTVHQLFGSHEQEPDRVVEPVPTSEARDVQALSGLRPIHYREAFAVTVDVDRTAEQWARALLEGAKPRKRRAMLTTWRVLGLELGPHGSPDHVLGWEILGSADDETVVLAVRSAAGLTARIVIRARAGRLVHTMVVRYERWPARAIWTLFSGRHRAFVRGLLHDLADPEGRDFRYDATP